MNFGLYYEVLVYERHVFFPSFLIVSLVDILTNTRLDAHRLLSKSSNHVGDDASSNDFQMKTSSRMSLIIFRQVF